MSAPAVLPAYGPLVTVKRGCQRCPACKSEGYHVQGDSGQDVYCAHPTFQSEPKQRKYIGDSTWSTPSWCPALAAAPEPPADPRDAEIQRLRALLTTEWEHAKFVCHVLEAGPQAPAADRAEAFWMVREFKAAVHSALTEPPNAALTGREPRE